MTAVFHAWPYGRFIEIQNNFRRKKLHRMNQGSNFHGGSFSNRGNVTAPIPFRREIYGLWSTVYGNFKIMNVMKQIRLFFNGKLIL